MNDVLVNGEGVFGRAGIFAGNVPVEVSEAALMKLGAEAGDDTWIKAADSIRAAAWEAIEHTAIAGELEDFVLNGGEVGEESCF